MEKLTRLIKITTKGESLEKCEQAFEQIESLCDVEIEYLRYTCENCNAPIR